MGYTKSILSYCAGIIDGEGCIGIIKRRLKGRYITYTLVVSVSNTNPQLMKFLYPKFRGSFAKRRSLKSYRPAYQWEIAAKSAGEFLKLILPYLLLKKPQAELALKFQARKRRTGSRGRTAEEKALEEVDYALMHKYNQGG